MREIDVEPNTPEWEAHRSKTRNASDAPVMMGASSKSKRSDFVRLKATGGEKEYSSWVTEVLFPRGHAVEPALRAYAEKIIGEDLYPVVGVSADGYLGASFDGVTMSGRINFEGKQYNRQKVQFIAENGTVPPDDYWQVVQQFAVNDKANVCFYVIGDGTDVGTTHVEVLREDVAADIPRLRAGWEQFDADVAAYQPEAHAAPVVAASVTALPAVSVRVDGEIVIRENFSEFEKAARDFIENRLIRKPTTDQDFADLGEQIKSLKRAEEALAEAESQMLAQISAVDAAKKTKELLHKLIRDNRLTAERLLESEKDRRRAEIVTGGKDRLAEHIDQINKTLGDKIRMPAVAADFAGAAKSKRTIATLQDAVDTELARAKIEANQVADRIRLNLQVLRTDAAGFETLFMDAQALVTGKSEEDLRNLVKSRIADHKAAEQARLGAERERIRKEEEARAKREAELQAEQDRQRIRDEEAAKLREELQQANKRRLDELAATIDEKMQGAAASGEEAQKGVDVLPAPTPRVEPPAPARELSVPAANAAPIRQAPPTPEPPRRPADAEIIHVLATHYRTSRAAVIGWLKEMNLNEAASAAKEAA